MLTPPDDQAILRAWCDVRSLCGPRFLNLVSADAVRERILQEKVTVAWSRVQLWAAANLNVSLLVVPTGVKGTEWGVDRAVYAAVKSGGMVIPPPALVCRLRTFHLVVYLSSVQPVPALPLAHPQGNHAANGVEPQVRELSCTPSIALLPTFLTLRSHSRTGRGIGRHQWQSHWAWSPCRRCSHSTRWSCQPEPHRYRPAYARGRCTRWRRGVSH